MEEIRAEVAIAGAGIAGLTTALGLHRRGIRSLVLETSPTMRVSGFAFATWANAWKALDAIGIGDALRKHHVLLDGVIISSVVPDQADKEVSFNDMSEGKQDDYFKGFIGVFRRDREVRCIKRKELMEALEKELPPGTIRYSSKVVSIEESGYFKLLQLADETIIKTKVLIGCDGVNSVVAKWLGLKTVTSSGRSAIRGYVDFKSTHGFRTKFLQFTGNGIRAGLLPCDDRSVYWFFTYTHSNQDKVVEDNPAKMKQFVSSKLEFVPENVMAAIEATELDNVLSARLRYRQPWELLWGNISKGNVTVAGDALHPMTPDLGQGGCSALEDGVVLARCLSEALKTEASGAEETDDEMGKEHTRIEMALQKYAKERRWRSFELVSTAFVVGSIQQSNSKVVSFLREKFLGKHLAGRLLKISDFECGSLTTP